MTKEEHQELLDRLHDTVIADKIKHADQLIASQNFEALPGCLNQLEIYQRLGKALESEIAYKVSKEPVPLP